MLSQTTLQSDSNNKKFLAFADVKIEDPTGRNVPRFLSRDTSKINTGS